MVLLTFVITVVAEIVVFVLVAQQIGVLAAIGLLLLVSLVGGAVLKAQGTRAWRDARRELREDRLPARTVFHGLFLALAGVLLAFPGFVTGVLGLVLLVPPVRVGLGVLAARSGGRWVRRRLGWVTEARTPFGSGRRDVPGPVVDAEGWEDPPRRRSSFDGHRSLPVGPPRREGGAA